MNPELDKYDADKGVIRLELSVQEVNTIFAALAELPHRVADPVMRNIWQQTQKPAE